MFSFEVLAEDGAARLGRLETAHGTVHTPSFVAVATVGSVRSLTLDDLKQIGTQIMIANTYHLYLRPGTEIIRQAGGLHPFMGWQGPLMTDSGGFQIFSLGAGKAHGVGKIAPIFPQQENKNIPKGPPGTESPRTKPMVKITDDGAEFCSYLDGSRHRFTPEGVIEIQRALGADLILVLDECTSPLHDYRYTRGAMNRTHQWAQRSLEAFRRKDRGDQALLGVVQGGAYRDLRQESAGFLSARDFDGFAIGGSLGNCREDMHRVLEWTIPLLPGQRPRHLLGIGTIEDIFDVVGRGVDLFDCIAPTRMAGTGTFFSSARDGFRLHILNSRFRTDDRPVQEGCPCYTCRHFSRAYLRHLFAANELLGNTLAAIHNLTFVESLMAQIRDAVKDRKLETLRRDWMG